MNVQAYFAMRSFVGSVNMRFKWLIVVLKTWSPLITIIFASCWYQCIFVTFPPFFSFFFLSFLALKMLVSLIFWCFCANLKTCCIVSELLNIWCGFLFSFGNLSHFSSFICSETKQFRWFSKKNDQYFFCHKFFIHLLILMLISLLSSNAKCGKVSTKNYHALFVVAFQSPIGHYHQSIVICYL